MNTRTLRDPNLPARQRGMSLLEILIAVLILGIGVLGIAAMQASALRNSQSAMQQSQAVITANAMLDSMRANPTGAYALTMATSPCTPPTAGATAATHDLHDWIAGMQSAIGPSACGGIVSNADGSWTVTVQWNETADPTQPLHVITMASRL